MVAWSQIERQGVRLACRDFGGDGPPVLLVHGLAGHAGEWADTARALAADHRVVAMDVRGHGRSERRPADVSPDAHVADAVLLIERMGLAPLALVGQSLGGVIALLVAAQHPELIRALVVAEASPEWGGADADREIDEVGERLGRWPVPFASRADAVAFFGGPSLAAEAWADGFEQRDDGLWPRFDVDVMVSTLRSFATRSYWAEWQRIRCPTLIVRAGSGSLGAGTARTMTDRLPGAELVEIEGATHDVHLDRPAQWRDAIGRFLREASQ